MGSIQCYLYDIPRWIKFFFQLFLLFIWPWWGKERCTSEIVACNTFSEHISFHIDLPYSVQSANCILGITENISESYVQASKYWCKMNGMYHHWSLQDLGCIIVKDTCNIITCAKRELTGHSVYIFSRNFLPYLVSFCEQF